MSLASSSTKGGGTCKPSGRLRGEKPRGKCQDNCCQPGKSYPVFHCSPPVTKRTKATLTLNNFERGGDGGGPSACDNKFHSDDTPVVALSTGWFNQKKRCHESIIIFGNGRRVKATVVDECDSAKGCDAEHGFQPPCPNNIVDASKAVWKALGVPQKQWGDEIEIEWSDACKSSGRLKGKTPHGKCQDNCCQAGKSYPTFQCSPPVTKRTKATLTLNSFKKGGDGGGPAACDNKFHSDDTPVVALSTGWFNHRKRCQKSIIIFGNGKKVKATVVDECDSTKGCDEEHGFQPPCPNNVVDGSKAVWEALGVPKKDWGELDVEWSDA
ncbi:uncharacterized protein LOC114727849 [Neltuma alba]|uniref:uncharacterized protein LOC114727849 n=1 Tax=Neltuma alba TaxID=207710 RepID=UPI0010A3EDB3|nr:uncharacterized protein LOC114727849 [Prosopis alba]